MLFKHILVLQFSLFFAFGRDKAPTLSNGQEESRQFIDLPSDGKIKYGFANIKLNYDDAEQFCEERSSRLVQIDTEEKRKEMTMLLFSLYAVINDSIKIYVWINSNSNITGYLPTILHGTPSDHTTKCYRIQKPLFAIAFSVDNCLNRHYFLCEDEANSPKPTVRVVRDEPVIKNLTHSIITNYPKDAPTSSTKINSLASTMDHILDAPSSQFMENDQQLLNETIFVVENALKNYNFEEGNLTLPLPNIRIQAIKITNQPHDSLSVGDIKRANTTSSTAVFDENLLQELFKRGNNNLQLTSVVYRRTDIFKGAEDVSNDVDEQSYQSYILTNVLSVSVGGLHISHLSTPLQVVSSIPQYITNKSLSEVDQRFSKVPPSVRQNPGKYFDGDMRYTVEEKCAFWDFSKSSWSTEGCRKESELQDGDSKEIKCSCDHMTHFAVILDLEGAYFPQYISTITIVGCWTSIVCLFLKILGSCCFKKLRKTPPQKILNRICSALFLANLFFVIGIDKREDEDACFAFTILLHYSVLSLWLWFLVQGLFFFRYLVWAKYRPGSVDVETSFKIATVLCYIVPAAIVASTAGALERNVYQSEKYCWLAREPMLYSIVIPIGTIIFINTVIFAVAFYNISCGRQMFVKESSLKELSLGLRRATSMMFTLGIPWTFGYMLLLSSEKSTKEIFSVLFSLLNSFQGVVIFILLFVRQKDVQNLVRAKFNKVLRRRPSTASTTSASRSSTRQKTRLMSVDSGKSISATQMQPLTRASSNSSQSDRVTKL